MYGTQVSNSLLVTIFLLGGVLGVSGQIYESEAQGLPPVSPSETPRELKSKRVGNAIPFADYEKRLRQSPRWQAMNSEEQAKALEKIERARKQFLDRQEQLKMQYDDQIKKMEKPRESLMSKRRKREQYQDGNLLWERFQALPVKQRFAVERQLGLDNVIPSQQQQKFQERLGRLSYSKRKHILRQLQQTSP
jgi:hypothetical protein